MLLSPLIKYHISSFFIYYIVFQPEKTFLNDFSLHVAAIMGFYGSRLTVRLPETEPFVATNAMTVSRREKEKRERGVGGIWP